MSCIITHKGKKYSEEQFKEYFINNKQEFATSIAKNKDVIDSFERKMEGIDYAFSQSPELASIGSKVQYLQYLSTIFPNSKVKDIVYHATMQGKFDSFDKNKVGKTHDNWGAFGKGFYFNDKIESALKHIFIFRGKKTVLPALLNIINPAVENNYTVEAEGDGTKYTESLLQKRNDGIIGEYKEGISEMYSNEYVVFEPEQIHLLGGKNDIEGFKDFTQTQNPNNVNYQLKSVEILSSDKIFLQKKSNTVKSNFNEELNQKIKNKLQQLYPQIKLEYTNKPIKTDSGEARGLADINAFKVLVNAIEQNQDTLPHEYAHHYIAWYRNSDLVQKGIKEFGSEEKLVQAIGENTVKSISFLDKLWNYIKSLFTKNVLDELTSSFLSAKDLGKYSLNENSIFYQDITESNNFLLNLGKQNGIKDDTFKENDWSEEVNTLVTQQYEQVNPTFEQKRNVEKLMSFSSDLSGSTEKNYILKNNTVLERASTIIDQDERFKFDNKFDELKYENNRIWGNQIDDILRTVIQFRFDDNQMQNVLSVIEKLRNKRGEESQINEEITQKLIYEFNNFLKQNPDKIAIPQVFLYNEGERIGGTADLILVDKFGNSEIIDLKSSVNPTNFNGRYFQDYKKVGESGEEYTNRYDKAFQNDRGSKKERHEAQLSMYAGMLESRAIPLKGTTILPIHIAETVGDTVTKVNVEKHFPLLLNTTYLNKTNIDSKHNFRIANTYETEFDQNVNKVVLAIKNEIALLKHIKTENTTYSI